MHINEAMNICLKNNTKVYPIVYGSSFKIQVVSNGKKKTFKNLLTGKALNEALTQTYMFYALKITNLKSKQA